MRAQDAADYLLSLAGSVDGRAGRDALFPAMLADSANTAATLVTIAKNTALPRETRRSALSYMGRSTDGMQTIPTSVTDPILAIARDETDNQSVRQQALSVLGRLDHGAGIPSLVQLSQQTQSNWLAKESMSTLSRSGDPRARQYLRTAVRRTDLPDEVLTVALRVARPGVRHGAGRRAASRGLSDAQDRSLARSRLLGARRHRRLGEHEVDARHGAERQRARSQMRRRALDAASRAGAPIAELVKLYDTTTDPNMKETLIGIYIRNGESPAIDKLLSIVKGEENLSLRKRTVNRLANSEDPRIKAGIAGLDSALRLNRDREGASTLGLWSEV